MSKSSRSGWRSKVYHGKASSGMGKNKHRALKTAFCKRCKYTCQACRKRRSRDLLSLHHIIPEVKGGSHDLNNLVLLCRQCHDRIEADIQKYRTYHDISYVFADRSKRIPVKRKTEVGIKWQQWVYGGFRNPMKDS